jgi:hypothetical protein
MEDKEVLRVGMSFPGFERKHRSLALSLHPAESFF